MIANARSNEVIMIKGVERTILKKEVHDKIFSMFTDPGHLKASDPGKIEGGLGVHLSGRLCHARRLCQVQFALPQPW